jgi:hypothetical protein
VILDVRDARLVRERKMCSLNEFHLGCFQVDITKFKLNIGRHVASSIISYAGIGIHRAVK